jgi:LacI family transcriptional regulator, galactose operon repressor
MSTIAGLEPSVDPSSDRSDARLEPTIRDVARRAGVSTATVSRVISGSVAARPNTRARVLAAAETLGYRPSAVARSLKLRTTRTVGLLVTDIENPYYPEIVRAVEDAALERELALLLCNGADDPAREETYLDLLVDRRVDGIIIASSGLQERHGAWLARRSMPVVLVNWAAPELGLPAILGDHRAGGWLAAEHLLALGHRRIGHLSAPARNAAAAQRLAGIRDALAAAGLDPAGLAVVEGDGRVSGGERAANELLDQMPDVTGVICYNDLTAIGAVRGLRTRGRHVPTDVSVVGYDDIALSSWVEPALTTIAQQTAEMGHWAVRRLAELIGDRGRGSNNAPRVTVLPVELRVRASTGPPPRGRPVERNG